MVVAASTIPGMTTLFAISINLQFLGMEMSVPTALILPF